MILELLMRLAEIYFGVGLIVALTFLFQFAGSEITMRGRMRVVFLLFFFWPTMIYPRGW